MKRIVLVVTLPVAVFAWCFIAGYLNVRLARRGVDTVRRTQFALGTLVEIAVSACDSARAQAGMNAAFAEIRRIDTLCSTYIPESPLRRFNESTDSVAVLPAEIVRLLERCGEFWRETDGAFDAALGRIVDVWGFETNRPRIPTKAVLARARRESGWRHVSLLPGNRVRRSAAPGRANPDSAFLPGFDLSAVAKGYAVDCAIVVLRTHGIARALVNAGGEIRCIGGPWAVSIRDPRRPDRSVTELRLTDASVATSGDDEQYFERGGVRFGHIFDPGTGAPARGCRSATVVAANCAAADALATGVFVLGPRRGIDALEALPAVEGMVVDDAGALRSTSGFVRLLAGRP